MIQTPKRIVVFYHAECPDGFSAAWAAWNKMRANAEYIGVNLRNPPKILEKVKGKKIYCIDYCPIEETLKKMVKSNDKVVVIDHHKTNANLVKHASESLFDLNHSGAVLAWKYFHPNKKTPKFLLHIEDVDIWNWKLPRTAEIISHLDLISFNFKEWDKMARLVENTNSRKKLVEEGKLLVMARHKLAEKIADRADLVEFEKRKILAVNAPGIFSSDVGHMLCMRKPPMAIVWSERDGNVSVSLRSDGSVNVRKIAEKYGGGGHDAASGFGFPANKKKPWKLINQ